MSSTGKVKIIGDYIFKDKIGKGSFADVYNCEHKTSGKRYALKIVNREHLLSMGEPRLITGLESEIKLMKEIDHENIVRLHDFFSTEKNFYLVLELCNGGDLNKYIKKRKILSEKVSIGFLLQLVLFFLRNLLILLIPIFVGKWISILAGKEFDSQRSKASKCTAFRI